MKSQTALAEEVKEADFPASGSVRDRLRFALQYAILAPSSHNSQPWHFVLLEDSVQVCADRTRALPVIDPYDRELTIGCGAALLNLRVALSYFNCPYQIQWFPFDADPDILAEVKICSDGFRDLELTTLFHALQRRATNRNAFQPAPIPVALQQALKHAAESEGASLAIVDDFAGRTRLAGLIAEADRIQFADIRFRRELASWIHSSRRGDGLQPGSLGMHKLLDMATPIVGAVIRTFDMGDGQAASHRALVEGSPMMVCLSTSTDDSSAWLAAGQAMERVLLCVTHDWYEASFLNQSIEVPSLRPRVAELTGGEMFPQILLRLGMGPVPIRSSRRPLSDALW